ncbi:hypothetical protein M422DRAFT_256548 [Sphaerobolus stellatus SS14]|uniref:Uncharacterized protein n=1 Tax=Sphaerobolus stellatus (strain SS14) TaxID=990650 RepID=A0A0C9VRH1_SPHS4|nr:hypothetical protein M422DRAFT_256548 [Sphaerobolus stellatus SS14]
MEYLQYLALQPQTLFLVEFCISPILLVVDPIEISVQSDSFILSPSTCRVYLLDHVGAVSAPPLDYHEEPLRSRSIISGMASESVENIRFDDTIRHDGSHIKIRTLVSSKGCKSSANDNLVVKQEYFSTELMGKDIHSWVIHK